MSTGSSVDQQGDEPLVRVGDKIKLKWPDESGTDRTVHAKVQSVDKSSKKKHGTFWKYELCLYKEGDAVISTRLVNLPWELSKKTKRSPDDGDEQTSPKKKKKEKHEKNGEKVETSTATTIISIPRSLTGKRTVPLESLRYIVAPMVGGSELAFRLLCRKYGATIAYTPMMNSEKFAVDADYRKTEFQTTPQDRPLVAHFSANNPTLFLKAAQHVQDHCDAIGKLTCHIQHQCYLQDLLYGIAQ